MINYREEVLKRTTGLEHWQIRLGLTNVPKYACRDIADFLKNRHSIEPNITGVIFPRLIYLSKDNVIYLSEDDKSYLRVPFSLQDDTGKMDVWATPQMYNEEAGELLVTSLARLRSGDAIYDVTVKNGIRYPTTFIEREELDDPRIYLSGFVNPRIRRPSKRRLSDLVSDLVPEFGLPAPDPVPVRH